MLQVTQCTGHISTNTRPHQVHWCDQEIGNAQSEVMPSHSGTADEAWYWVLCSGWLSIHGDMVVYVHMHISYFKKANL